MTDAKNNECPPPSPGKAPQQNLWEKREQPWPLEPRSSAPSQSAGPSLEALDKALKVFQDVLGKENRLPDTSIPFVPPPSPLECGKGLISQGVAPASGQAVAAIPGHRSGGQGRSS